MSRSAEEQQVINDCWMVVQNYRNENMNPVKSAVFRRTDGDNSVSSDKSSSASYNLGIDILPDAPGLQSPTSKA